MFTRRFLRPRFVVLCLAAATGTAGPAIAQAPDGTTPTLCGQAVPAPAQLPPEGSGPLVYLLGLCFEAQGNVSSVEPQTYLYYVRLRPSRPSQSEWVPFDDEAVAVMRADFQRLWDTGFLDDLRIEASDYTFANGVAAKIITYHLEERPRVRLIEYEGTRVLDRTKIDEELRNGSVNLRLDSFVDERTVARVSAVLRRMLAEKGHPDATVRSTLTPVAGGPRLVNVTFHIADGPRTVIRDVEFLGNKAIADGRLTAAIKTNRSENLLSFASGGGRYQAEAFAEDAQRVEDYYRDAGYIRARVGQPELRALDDSRDGSVRWVQLRIPVTEGARYRIGHVSFDGNSVLSADVLRTLFKVREGDWYNQASFRDGLTKARELYGAGGYMEFTGVPDLQPRDEGDTSIVDVTVRLSEGERYVVNRLTIAGNTTTRDAVIRRELQLVEGGVFNAEALKYSIQRLNQLGYFKPLEANDRDLQVEKTPGRERSVDVTLKVEEQNRNQMQFGAGVSQYEGIFGNVSFTTTNFLGRGESVTITAQKGSRSANYEFGVTEPYIFERPISAGINLYSRKIDYWTSTSTLAYSEVRSGLGLTVGRPLFRFSRLFLGYGYEIINTAVDNDVRNSLDAGSSVGIPIFDPLLDEGRHTESRVTLSFVHNTVNNPYQPTRGIKLTLSAPIAGGVLGGTTNYVKPEAEAIVYIPHTRRTALGLRVNGGMVRPFGGTHALPYYNRYFLGGENQIRGVNIRTVGPTDRQNRAIGGDRFVLFNAEYYFDLFGPVRALLFHDAGQAYSEGQSFDLRRLRTSSGAELRFMVPVLNVPFRLIYAWNLYRDSFQPARTFKFAVGTTF